jgi:hypothetical protein
MADLQHDIDKMPHSMLSKIQRASVHQKISSLLFLEEYIEDSKLQREFLLYSQKIKSYPETELRFKISPDYFILGDDGEIIGSSYKNLKTMENSPLLLRISISDFLENIQRVLKNRFEYQDETYIIHSESHIFWDIWNSLKNLKGTY